jgi:hypothetical protein
MSMGFESTSKLLEKIDMKLEVDPKFNGSQSLEVCNVQSALKYSGEEVSEGQFWLRIGLKRREKAKALAPATCGF